MSAVRDRSGGSLVKPSDFRQERGDTHDTRQNYLLSCARGVDLHQCQRGASVRLSSGNLIGGRLPGEIHGGKRRQCTLIHDRAFRDLQKNKAAGEVTAAKAGTIAFTFEECESVGVKCTTAGSPTGVILATLKFIPVLIKNGTPLEAGLLLTPASGTVFAKFECGALAKVEARGSLACKIEPININTKGFELKCREGTKAGTTAYPSYEESPGGGVKAAKLEASLNGAAFAEAVIANEDVITMASMIEIRA